MQRLENNNSGFGGGGFLAAFLVVLGLMLAWQFLFLAPEQQAALEQAQAQSKAEAESTTPVVHNPNVPIVQKQLENEQFSLTFTNAGSGRVSHILLKNPDRYAKHGEYLVGIRQNKDGDELSDDQAAPYFPFATTLPAFGMDSNTPFTFDETSNNEIQLHYTDSTGLLKVQKNFKTSTESPYTLDMRITLQNNTTQVISDKLDVSLYNRQIKGQEASLFSPGAPAFIKCFADDDVEELAANDTDENDNYTKKVQWIAADESYFALAIQSNDAAACNLANDKDGNMRADLSVPITIPAQGTLTKDFKIYIGPKEDSYLKPFEHDLEEIIDYGWMEILAKPMSWLLAVFHGWTGNWGVAIILLTLIIRLLLWPVAQSSQESMLRMSKLTPLLQELQEKYKDDPQTLQQKQLEIYKENKVNPFGCLPLLLQMPVFFALYRTIFVTGGLYNAEFIFWIRDLTASDPYFVLPVLTIVVFVLQQLTSQTKPKTTQQKIMIYGMPLFFGIMMIFLPAGLCLYMFISSLFSVLQSFYTRYKMAKADAANATSDTTEAAANAKQRRAAKRRKQD